MKKYSGSFLIIDDDQVMVKSHMVLKQCFENIETLTSPKSLVSKLNLRRSCGHSFIAAVTMGYL